MSELNTFNFGVLALYQKLTPILCTSTLSLSFSKSYDDKELESSQDSSVEST
ncbi:hypothetical protein [Helicobacter sp.]|uniref:hypothetical protein n=1 Tax=Helicobacter sp. TaxID=218 RepID=UPI0025BC0D05|nr:hypothetical protein [Helicobacter sp.]MBR2495537.1 hypothetical protein [Helicobacter sp.]